MDWLLPDNLVDWAQVAGAGLSLLAVVVAFGAGQALRARDLLMLLPGPSDLPLLRVAVDARPSEEAKAAFAARYPSATTLPSRRTSTETTDAAASTLRSV